MRMETWVLVSWRGHGATRMCWSDMSELKLINGCSGLEGIQKRRAGQMEGAEWI